MLTNPEVRRWKHNLISCLSLLEIHIDISLRFCTLPVNVRWKPDIRRRLKWREKVDMVAACVPSVLFIVLAGIVCPGGEVQLNKGHGMKEILASYEGKRVAVRLDSGEEVEGLFTTLETNWFHLSKLSKRIFMMPWSVWTKSMRSFSEQGVIREERSTRPTRLRPFAGIVCRCVSGALAACLAGISYPRRPLCTPASAQNPDERNPELQEPHHRKPWRDDARHRDDQGEHQSVIRSSAHLPRLSDTVQRPPRE